MRDEPFIYSGRAVKRTKATPARAGKNLNNAAVQLTEVTE